MGQAFLVDLPEVVSDELLQVYLAVNSEQVPLEGCDSCPIRLEIISETKNWYRLVGKFEIDDIDRLEAKRKLQALSQDGKTTEFLVLIVFMN